MTTASVPSPRLSSGKYRKKIVSQIPAHPASPPVLLPVPEYFAFVCSYRGIRQAVRPAICMMRDVDVSLLNV